MARGWESKSVEEQQAEAKSEPRAPKPPMTPEEIARQRQKQSFALSRSRVLQRLESATSPTHRQMLEAALADLDARIARLG